MEEEEEKDNAIGHELPCNWEQFINLSRQTTRQQSGESPSLLFSLTLRSQRRPSSHGGREGGRETRRLEWLEGEEEGLPVP